jgi:hypothetical protein
VQRSSRQQEAQRDAAETSYCAFEVKVVTASGTPRSKVPVQLIRDKTEVFGTSTDAYGLARLCDSPLESVDIAVGFDVCGLVTVRNLYSMWPKTKQVFVIFEENPCSHFVAAPYVQVLMRIQDHQGRPVAGAQFDEDSPSMGSGSEASGEERAPVSVLCSDDVELKIVLHKPD